MPVTDCPWSPNVKKMGAGSWWGHMVIWSGGKENEGRYMNNLSLTGWCLWFEREYPPQAPVLECVAPVSEIVKGLGDVTLLEVVQHWDGALRSQRPTLGPVSLSLSWLPAVDQDVKLPVITRRWWCMPLIPALRRQRQVGLCEFGASLVYRVSSRTAGLTSLNSYKHVHGALTHKIIFKALLKKWLSV